MKRQIFLLILLLTSFSSYSFNCKKAALPVDFVICSSDAVFKVNEAHEKAWFETRARLDNQQKKELVILQKEWLNTFPLKCNIAIKGKAPKTISPDMQVCIKNELEARYNFLSTYTPHNAMPHELDEVLSSYKDGMLKNSKYDGSKGEIDGKTYYAVSSIRDCSYSALLFSQTENGKLEKVFEAKDYTNFSCSPAYSSSFSINKDTIYVGYSEVMGNSGAISKDFAFKKINNIFELVSIETEKLEYTDGNPEKPTTSKIDEKITKKQTMSDFFENISNLF